MNCDFLSWDISTCNYDKEVKNLIDKYGGKKDLVIIRYKGNYYCNSLNCVTGNRFDTVALLESIVELRIKECEVYIIHSNERLSNVGQLLKRYKNEASIDCIDRLRRMGYEL
jgi:hypothetical protein